MLTAKIGPIARRTCVSLMPEVRWQGAVKLARTVTRCITVLVAWYLRPSFPKGSDQSHVASGRVGYEGSRKAAARLALDVIGRCKVTPRRLRKRPIGKRRRGSQRNAQDGLARQI